MQKYTMDDIRIKAEQEIDWGRVWRKHTTQLAATDVVLASALAASNFARWGWINEMPVFQRCPGTRVVSVGRSFSDLYNHETSR